MLASEGYPKNPAVGGSLRSCLFGPSSRVGQGLGRLTLIKEPPPRVSGSADGRLQLLKSPVHAVQRVLGPFGVADVDHSMVRPERNGILAKPVIVFKPIRFYAGYLGRLALIGEEPS